MLSIDDLSEVMSTYELPNIETPDDGVFGSVKIAIQIIRKGNGKFYPRIMRREKIEAAPTYGSTESRRLMDKMTIEISTPDESFDFEMFDGNSVKDALLIGLNGVNEAFSEINEVDRQRPELN
ncbi:MULTISPECIES: hypothetical protein [Delftia]|uniref:Uncharacterized protein n=2 Tax=Delftia TaxID=80865 RepID=A0A7T2S0K8_DELAC|nr:MULTISPECIES: hypothetical protein [Delftia]MBL8357465.1 hypothetical protein [Delftia acidovorans]QPS06769.1 hypothetical protein I6G66_21000 [Delftia acidovorans]